MISSVLRSLFSYPFIEDIKSLLACILYYSGIAYAVGLFKKKGAAVLLYHSISEGGGFYDNIVFPHYFERHIAYLKKKFEIVPFSHLLKQLSSGKPIPSNWIVLSFDDGYKDNALNVLPLLKKYGISAIFFIPTGIYKNKNLLLYDRIQQIIDKTSKQRIKISIDGKTFSFGLNTQRKKNDAVIRMALLLRCKNKKQQEKGIEVLKKACDAESFAESGQGNCYLSLGQTKALASFGMEIGGHTRNHFDLTQVSEEQFAEEIDAPKKMLEEMIQTPVNIFSYPFGRRQIYSDVLIERVKKAGYQAAVTNDPGKVQKGMSVFELPRIAVRNADLARLKVNLLGIPI